MIKLHVGSHIAFPCTDIPLEVLGQIKSDLLIENPVRIEQQKQKIYGWQNLPQYIQLYEERQGWMKVPRGYLLDLLRHLPEFSWDIIHETVSWPTLLPEPRSAWHWSLRLHQAEAVHKIQSREIGIIEAPTGSGKTVTVLAAIKHLNERAVIVVDKTNIVSQWVERCEHFLGFTPGIVGDGQWDQQQPVTVAMVQTLCKLPADDPFFNDFGFACLDECHHVTADTYLRVMESFTSKYRIGVSATPDRDNGLVPVALAVLGPVIHSTTRNRLEKLGLLIKPTVHRIQTDFQFSYWGTHTANPGQQCDKPDCIRNDKHGHRNNYAQMLTALVEDDDRNELIIRRVLDNKEHRNLVISKRLGHLDRLQQILDERLPSVMLTGRESTEERAEAVRRAAEGPCVLFSTLADEALDIPELDRIYLTWPTKSTAVINQQIGRIVRPAEGKTDALVYDFVDTVGPMYRQGMIRWEFYGSEGFLTADTEEAL
jgi:superfamily II DNA or RNA helicase